MTDLTSCTMTFFISIIKIQSRYKNIYKAVLEQKNISFTMRRGYILRNKWRKWSTSKNREPETELLFFRNWEATAQLSTLNSTSRSKLRCTPKWLVSLILSRIHKSGLGFRSWCKKMETSWTLTFKWSSWMEFIILIGSLSRKQVKSWKCVWSNFWRNIFKADHWRIMMIQKWSLSTEDSSWVFRIGKFCSFFKVKKTVLKNRRKRKKRKKRKNKKRRKKKVRKSKLFCLQSIVLVIWDKLRSQKFCPR